MRLLKNGPVWLALGTAALGGCIASAVTGHANIAVAFGASGNIALVIAALMPSWRGLHPDILKFKGVKRDCPTDERRRA